jgi:predicted Fe-Mo cluster-binding NifX family protein
VVMHTPSHRIADQVADRLELLIPQKFPLVVMARIRPHYSKNTGDDAVIRRLTPVMRPEGSVSPHFACSPWFLIETVDSEDGRVIKRDFVENQYAEQERKKGLLVGNWLLSLKPDEVIIPNDREGAAAALLREAGVEILSKTA